MLNSIYIFEEFLETMHMTVQFVFFIKGVIQVTAA